MLERGAENLNLSMRAFLKTQKVARTIADLEQSENVNENILPKHYNIAQ